MPFSPLIAASSSHAAAFRAVLLPLVAGAAAIYLLLPRPQGRQLLLGALFGIAALVLTGLLIVNVGGVSVETVLFYIFSGLALVSGTLLVTQHNPARAALSFTLVILNVCGLFVLLAAPFLMVATIIIYAGAIVVTFLFILMLAQQTGPSDADDRSREPLLASLTGFVLLGALLYVLQIGFLPQTQQVDPRLIDPFLSRIHAAEARQSPTEMTDALALDPGELNTAIEKMQLDRDQTKTEKQREDAARLLAEELKSDHTFLFRLKKALEMLGRKDLADLTENGLRTDYDWPEDAAERTPEKIRAVLKNYEGLVLAARQDVGLTAPDWERAKVSSGLSGPPSALAGQLRRDDSGRPQAPAENAAHLGKSLFTDYLLPVELGGFLLLIAAVGAIAIAHRLQVGEGAMNPLLFHYLAVGAILFVLGLIGFLARRNLIVMFLCAEMMLQGVAINLVAFARYRGNLQGQAFVLFVLTVAACEAAVALALILMLYKTRNTLDVSVWQELREADLDRTEDDEPLPPPEKETPLPHLRPSGPEPEHRPETSHV